MDEIGRTLLARAVSNAQRDLERAVAAAARHIASLEQDPDQPMLWVTLAREAAEGAAQAARLAALRDVQLWEG